MNTIIILGSGIAALSAAREIRKHDRDIPIEIYSDENIFCYNRPMLSKKFLSDFDAEKYFARMPKWCRENKVMLELENGAQDIDLQEKSVTLRDGSRHEYDKLIYATGARSRVPDVPGAEMDHVISIRDLSDAEKVKDRLSACRHITVIGGGMLGLEEAWRFHNMDKEVTVIEREQLLMHGQLDHKGSQLLEKAVRKSKVTVLTGTEVLKIEKDAVFAKGKEHYRIPAELVIVSAGITPNAEVGIRAGLSAKRSGGSHIDVDKHMRTSDPSVFAAGDVAYCQESDMPVFSHAMEMGRVAGANAAGQEETYHQPTHSFVFSGFDTDIFSMGEVHREGQPGWQDIDMSEARKHNYIRLYFHEEQFAGGILINAQDLTTEVVDALEKRPSPKEMAQIVNSYYEKNHLTEETVAKFKQRYHIK